MYGMTFEKPTVFKFIVINDIFSMILFIIFTTGLSDQFEDYCSQFDDQKIEMKDFGVRIDKLPRTFE